MTPLYMWAKLMKKLRSSAVANSRIHPTSKVESGSHIVNSRIDRHSFCGYDCEVVMCDIGAFCSIGNAVRIGGGRHPMEWVAMSPVFYAGRDSVRAKFSAHEREPSKRTIIGNDVWIGAGAFIRQGVRVGHGAVVGMGSVVTRDVDDYAVVAGSPARLLHKRFDDHTIARLLAVSWWNFSDEELVRLAPYIKDPHRFLQEAERL